MKFSRLVTVKTPMSRGPGEASHDAWVESGRHLLTLAKVTIWPSGFCPARHGYYRPLFRLQPSCSSIEHSITSPVSSSDVTWVVVTSVTRL